MSLGHRIRTLRKQRGITQTDMARRLNTAPNTLSNWENDIHEPSREKVRDIARILDCDIAELEGEGFGDEEVSVYQDLGDVVFVPEFKTRASAGGGMVIEQGEKVPQWPFSRSYLIEEIGARPEDCGVFEVYGDSMEPNLRSGDRVLTIFSRKNPAQPGIYVIAMMGEAVIKRLELIPGTKPPRIRVSSDNPLHHSYEVDAEDIEIIGWAEIRVTRI